MFLNDSELKERLEQKNNLSELLKPGASDSADSRRSNNDINSRKNERAESPVSPEDNTTIVPLHNGGRRAGDKNINPLLRTIIGSVAHLDTAKNVAKEFNVSPHHVHELKHGKTTTDTQDKELVDSINETLKTPHELAVSKLSQTLLQITPDKLAGENSPLKLASIASQLARVAEATAPIKRDDDKDPHEVRLVVYAPSFKQENNYETVQVGAE